VELVTDLWYEVSGSGPPVVLLHEGVVDSRIWDRVLPLLSDRYRVIRYDQRGFGRSPLPDGPYAVADDLVSILDAADAGGRRTSLPF
jgi:pimeloyl-ACP methyl ester carboxylesterase